MNITRESWDRFRGQTDWRNGKPGDALIHVPCGGNPIQIKVQLRSLWEGPGPCSGRGQTIEVGELYCPKCDQEPTTIMGAGIVQGEFFDPEV